MNRKSIVAIFHNIRSRENVGSMFRTADAAGIAKLYLCGITPCPKNMKHESWNKKDPKFMIQDSSDKIAKTALGAERWVPWEYHLQTWRLIEQLKKDGYRIIALEKTKKSDNVFSMRVKGPIALVVGNEVRGLSPEILKRSDKTISIPMRGKKESLNVAVAFGIAAYQLTKD